MADELEPEHFILIARTLLNRVAGKTLREWREPDMETVREALAVLTGWPGAADRALVRLGPLDRIAREMEHNPPAGVAEAHNPPAETCGSPCGWGEACKVNGSCQRRGAHDGRHAHDTSFGTVPGKHEW